MKVQVILASIRPGRITERVANWVVSEAEKIDGFEVELVDLKDYELPLFDEEASPQYNPERQPEGVVKEWLDKLGEADAYVVVSPEYNRSIPGAISNAFDYVDFQFANKPVALVTHGSVGGAYAMSNYRSALAQMLAVTVPEPTMIVSAGQVIDEDGTLTPEAKANPYGPDGALSRTLESLRWYAAALMAARAGSRQAVPA